MSTLYSEVQQLFHSTATCFTSHLGHTIYLKARPNETMFYAVAKRFQNVKHVLLNIVGYTDSGTEIYLKNLS